ncbi:hypothetical protein [Thermococcus sp. AM4]|uniref:hypothetical protein n=1 Tax=Thermococcus sp. (strain AM4) TaxID=246969 RepID=UPI00018707D0|nr:hypothetical protein [Thermococcus sp. AM4]EEB74129.1 conserved hypothetical protein [Thermococcus sp. AM4]
MRTYSFGTETVPVALAGDLLVGSVHDGRNYKIMLARLNGDEIAETRFLAGKNDWEGHSGAKLDDGYLIGGAVEGTAAPDGGEGWKAYLARLDENLNALWELKLEVRSNGTVYSILPAKDGFFIAGETGRPGNRGFFIGRISREGRLLWLKDFGSWEDAVFTALLPSENWLKLLGSVKDGCWEVRSFDFDEKGGVRGEEALAEGIAFTAGLWNEELVLAGYRGEKFWVRTGEGEIQLGEGSATSLLPLRERLLVGGELEGNAVVVEIVGGKGLKVRKLWENGWVEVLGEGIVAGVTEDWEMVIVRFSP